MRRLRYRIINMQISVFTFFLIFLATLTLFPSHIHAQADTTQAHQYWVKAQTLRDSAKLDSAFPYYMAAGDAFWGAAAKEGDTAIASRAYVSKSKASSILSMKRDFRGANEILRKTYDLLASIHSEDIDKRVATMGSMGRNYN
ncbi:MAG: hypothetical protein AAFQ83_09000, partial [Bacteroidota bacterium]